MITTQFYLQDPEERELTHPEECQKLYFQCIQLTSDEYLKERIKTSVITKFKNGIMFQEIDKSELGTLQKIITMRRLVIMKHEELHAKDAIRANSNGT